MGNILGTIIEVIKENTRSLHYSSSGGGSMGNFKRGATGNTLKKERPKPKREPTF